MTLALGIGVSAAVFSALNALVLRPAPIKDPSGLIGVWPMNARGQRTSTLAPVADLVQDGPLESVCAYGSSSVGVEANGIPVYAAVEIVTHHCFATIGVPPLLGRVFTAEEAPASRPGTRVVVIGYSFWQKMFGGAPDVVGRSFKTDGDPVTVIGIMPRGFRGLRVDDGVDIIAPFGTVIPSPPNRLLASYILGRLRPGVTLEAARTELATRWPPMMDRVVPTTLSPAVFYGVATQLGAYGFYSTLQIAASADPWQLVDPLQDTLRGLGREYAFSITTLDERLQRNAVHERMSATLAMPVATLAALLAFVGVYSLFAYAVIRRTREIGVRLAVGASPGAVLRMVLRESLTLTAIGVALGVPAGIIGSRGLRALLFGVSESDPLVAASVTVFFTLLTIAAVLIPARRAARLDPIAALRAE